MPSPHTDPRTLTAPQTRADDLYRTLRAMHSPLAAALMAAAITRRWPAESMPATALHTR
ncbi:hypothetical protein JMUB6875_70660 [Nocardia sp. JMUB6875]